MMGHPLVGERSARVEQPSPTDILHRSPALAGAPGRVEQPGVFAGLSSRRSRVQIPSCPPPHS